MQRLYAHIRSFGCQMNKLDTALVRAAVLEAGMELTDHPSQADIVIINTCSVRDHAEQRAISHLGHLQHIKERRPRMVVAVIGCMAQRLGQQLLAHPAVDIVCGPMQIPELVDMCRQALTDHTRAATITQTWQKDPSDNGLEQLESTHPVQDLPGQAYVRVMRGCNRACSYCIVPRVRGPEHSRPPQAVMDQVRRLADQGVKVITLLGQTVNAYRYRSGQRTFILADLLEMVSQVNGIEWVRFITSYPMERYFDQILTVMASNKKVCPYLHIPAQSGSDRILRAMNRTYTAQQYIQLIQKARQMVPRIAIAGDFIVGFPGETDQDFQATIDLVTQVRYKNCFVFRYSPRPGTAAYDLKQTVDQQQMATRHAQLLSIQEQISGQIAKTMVGQVVKVIVEGPSKKAERHLHKGSDFIQLVGRTDTDWPVVFDGPMDLAGRFATVVIEKAGPYSLFGRLVRG